MNKKLSLRHFQKKETLELSKNLLGKFLVSNINNQLTSGVIVEVEAYLGKEDRACHAFGGRKSKRTEVMYLPGGHWYVYVCYGIHSLVNIVTHEKDEPHAILIRAIEPYDGIDYMLLRRKMEKVNRRLTSGPGSLAMAFGMTKNLTGEPLGNQAWIECRGVSIPERQMIACPRIGIAYAGEDALLPYRFYIKNNRWVSCRV